MDMNARPIVGKNYRIIKHKKGPSFGTIDLLVELIPLPPPTPEKFQRKARLRRLKQQGQDSDWAIAQVEADYAKRS